MRPVFVVTTADPDLFRPVLDVAALVPVFSQQPQIPRRPTPWDHPAYYSRADAPPPVHRPGPGTTPPL